MQKSPSKKQSNDIPKYNDQKAVLELESLITELKNLKVEKNKLSSEYLRKVEEFFLDKIRKRLEN